MRVALLSSEAVPYAKTGGLADVAGALPKALRQVGISATLITPLYRQTKKDLLAGVAIEDLLVDWRGGKYPVKVFYSQAGDAPAYLIDAPEFFDRDSIYGFREDYLRFAFFCRAAEKSKTKIVFAKAVDRITIEKFRRVDQVRGSVARLAVKNFYRIFSPAPIDKQVFDRHTGKQVFFCLPVKRRDQRRRNADLPQRLRQRAGNISQPAGLGVGNCFGG